MSKFDVRGNGVGNITEIIFSDSDDYCNAISVQQNHSKDKIYLDNNDKETIAELDSKDVPNLILALQKAVELGWVPKPKVAAVKKPAVKKVAVTKKVVKK